MRGGTLPSQGIPNALKNIELRALLPNTLTLVLYLSLCQTICSTSLTQPLFSRAHWPSFATWLQSCKSVLVLKEWGGSSAWSLTAPLNSVGLVIKWLDEWAISVCQLLVWPGELGRCQTEWRPASYQQKHMHTHTHTNTVKCECILACTYVQPHLRTCINTLGLHTNTNAYSWIILVCISPQPIMRTVGDLRMWHHVLRENMETWDFCTNSLWSRHRVYVGFMCFVNFNIQI